MERDLTGNRRANGLGGPGVRHPRTRRAIVLAIGLLFALAVLAPVGLAHEASAEGLAAKLERASKAAERTAQRAEHLAERAAERATSKQKRAAERLARREARHKERESRRSANKAHKEKEGNGVAIDCTKVTVTYRGFPTVEGKPNYVVEWIAVKNPPESISKEPIVFPPLIYSFEGSTGTEVVHIPFPVGHYLIDVHAKWDTNGHKGNFDIHGNVTCMPEPAYTITKVQSLEGSAGAPTSEPLTGKVGQTVDYQITVTNTGNTPLTFTRFTDEHCESIEGGSLDPIEPLQTLSYFCSHKLTAADQTAGSYSNVASVTASTEPGEGGPLPPKKSNTVVVSPIAPETPKGEEKHEEKPGRKTRRKTRKAKHRARKQKRRKRKPNSRRVRA